ncbi:MAG TPA: hypothetical protein VLQ91_17925 [Draconibacterium sp.]|nr:hypothetical protein [Draconibacterium sp.]
MNKLSYIFILILTIQINVVAQPISLHPQNTHYFLFKGKPAVLVTSAEHYGAVLNADFDYKKYLQTMHDEGMNYTRIFTGSYVEIPGSFGILNNSLAPATGSFLAPWKRVEEPGLFEGEKKFDLNEWNPEYFERLNDFISLANELDIIVEVTLFCATYDDRYWLRHPFNPGNNINNIPINLERQKSNTLENNILTGFQQKLVEKLVTELNGFDNVFYEIQNEPWADDGVKVMRTLRTLDPEPEKGSWYKWAEMASPASLEWQKLMAKTVVETEMQLPKKHIIAQNYTNFMHSLDNVDPNISILNFHYVWPEAVWMNYGWNRPVSFDESGFAGSSDSTYLRQAWQFMMAGGAVFNNLDYSFYVGKEDGTGINTAPGGGSKNLRRQLTYLRAFIESFDFVQMKPDFNVVVHSPGVQVQAISQPGNQYAMVFTGVASKSVKLNLPKGKYNFEFVSPYSGKTLNKGFFKQKKSGIFELKMPDFGEMAALKIVK